MDFWSALLLGIVQGVTEFLPVSSSGHLEIAKVILGETVKEEGLLFTIVLHTATALSTILVFRKEIIEILKGLLEFKNNESWRFTLLIIISMVPAAIVGLFLEDQIALLFEGNLLLVGGALLLTALLLRLADRQSKDKNPLTTKNAAIIGLTQAIAILPGISRSGSTIATAVLLGIDREKATRFSFLMVIPLIVGSMLKSILDYDSTEMEISIMPLFVGFIAALLTGIVACRWMITLVKKSQLSYFALYCLVVGMLSLSYEFFG